MLFRVVLTTAERQREINVSILVIVTIGRAFIIASETGVAGENFCLWMLFFLVSLCCMFDGHRNQAFTFTGAADCLPHYLRPEEFALPVIKQEVPYTAIRKHQA